MDMRGLEAINALEIPMWASVSGGVARAVVPDGLTHMAPVLH